MHPVDKVQDSHCKVTIAVFSAFYLDRRTTFIAWHATSTQYKVTKKLGKAQECDKKDKEKKNTFSVCLMLNKNW